MLRCELYLLQVAPVKPALQIQLEFEPQTPPLAQGIGQLELCISKILIPPLPPTPKFPTSLTPVQTTVLTLGETPIFIITHTLSEIKKDEIVLRFELIMLLFDSEVLEIGR